MDDRGDLPRHIEGRKATWFELFFDLVFVVAVAQLSAAYAHQYNPAGALAFALAFLAMWWCWLGHTFHATRFDDDTGRRRGLGVLHTAAVVLIGYGVSDPLGGRAWAFGGGLAAFKGLLALAYVGERRWRGAAGLIRVYATLYAVQTLLWLAGALTEPLRWAAWGLALALDLASPWLVAKHTEAVPPHPEHLPERFGLFTIILLGEGMAAVVHALDHGEHLYPSSVMAALLGGAAELRALAAVLRPAQRPGAAHGRGCRWRSPAAPLGLRSCAAVHGDCQPGRRNGGSLRSGHAQPRVGRALCGRLGAGGRGARTARAGQSPRL